MKPGIELDTLVAEKVLNWSQKIINKGAIASENEIIPWGVLEWSNENGEQTTLPAFSTNISDAWQIVEHLQNLGYFFSLKMIESRVNCFFQNSAGKKFESGLYEEGVTTPEAICLAALKIKGVEID